MTLNIKDKLQNNRRPNFIGKNFNDFKQELFDYARLNFSDQINDFNETSLGGMLLDFASIVGESLAFYTEQQVNELDYELATNPSNINKHLRNAGIKNNYSSPSVVKVKFEIEVPALDNNQPDSDYLPIIKKGTQVSTTSDINFILQEDVDFRSNYNLEISEEDENGNVEYFFLEKEGHAISGNVKIENVLIPSDTDNTFVSYELEEEDVSKIVSVIDSDFNTYYEVEYLSQDTVYVNNNFFEIKYASHRFIKEMDFNTGKSTLRFGNGDNRTLKDNILNNPEDIALPILGRNYTSNFSLDPNMILKSNSLGISPQGKNLSIKYFYGGGSEHNVNAFEIENINEIKIEFPNITSTNEEIENEIINSLSVVNEEGSIGGEDRKTIEELKEFIPNALLTQNRIVNNKDFLSRIYTMPGNFGNIHKATILTNPYSNLTKDMFIICKDSNGFYVNAPDTLKINLKNYIEEFRIIGDSYNILDAPIYNFGINMSLRVSEGFEVEEVLNEVALNIFNNMRFDKLQIGQAINTSIIKKIALDVRGVMTIMSNDEDIIVNKNSSDNLFDEDTLTLFEYSNNNISIIENFHQGLVYPSQNGIFELKYSIEDITIRNI